MTMDIKDFYLNTPMARYEYMQLRIADMPDDIIEHYNLRDKTTPDGYIYCEIQKGMYGLPQAGIIAQQLLEECLRKHGYGQSQTTPGLWKHDTCLLPGRQQFQGKVCGRGECTALIRHCAALLQMLMQLEGGAILWTYLKLGL